MFLHTGATDFAIAEATDANWIVAVIFCRTVTTGRTLDHHAADLLIDGTMHARNFIGICEQVEPIRALKPDYRELPTIHHFVES